VARVLQVVIEDLEGIALLLEPLDAARQGGLELVDAAQGVVEGDDGAVAGVLAHIVEHLVCRKMCGVVACDEIPHDDGVVAADADVLLILHPSAWWTEKVGMDELVGLVGVAQEVARRHG